MKYSAEAFFKNIELGGCKYIYGGLKEMGSICTLERQKGNQYCAKHQDLCIIEPKDINLHGIDLLV